jgi:hypothetical protein
MTAPTPELVATLLGPVGPEIGCDECFEQLDGYVELEIAGADAEASTPGMRAHLAGCPACHEEHESLHALVMAGEEQGDHA